MEDIYVLGVDIGGSHIACQLVNLSDCSLIENTYAEVKVAENQSAGIILAAWEKALKECMGKAAGKIIRGIGVAMPSPFDFVQGIAMADHKFASLKGLNIRQELSRVTGILPSSILFTNDAAAFGMGAWRLNGSRDRHLSDFGYRFRSLFYRRRLLCYLWPRSAYRRRTVELSVPWGDR